MTALIQDWKYSEHGPSFAHVGAFNAWIGCSNLKSHSAAAWRVEPKNKTGEEAVEVVHRSDGSSTAPRAILGALAGVLETLPPDSTVDLYTNSEYVETVISNVAVWKSEGWEGPEGPRPNVEILGRIERVLRVRRIPVYPRHIVKNARDPNYEILERLKRMAKSACREA